LFAGTWKLGDDVMQREVADMVNGGVIYVQNAHPQGPAVWLLQELSRRVLRMAGGYTHTRHCPSSIVARVGVAQGYSYPVWMVQSPAPRVRCLVEVGGSGPEQRVKVEVDWGACCGN